MKKPLMILFASTALLLTACQSSKPKTFDGTSGYNVEQQNQHMATLRYTMSAKIAQPLKQKRLQAACKQVLGGNKDYKIQILDEQEILQNIEQPTNAGVKIANSRTSIGFSHTADLKNNDHYITNQALEHSNNVLSITRYICKE